MQNNFEDMTINEKLFRFELLDEYNLAVNNRDRKKLVEILKKVSVSEEQANSTVDAIFSDPKKYGYELKGQDGKKDKVIVMKGNEKCIILPAVPMPLRYIDQIKSYAASQKKIERVFVGQMCLNNETSKLIAIEMSGDLESIIHDLNKITKNCLSGNEFVDYIQVSADGVVNELNTAILTLIYQRLYNTL